jgi:iron complex outermembrane recepter protein
MHRLVSRCFFALSRTTAVAATGLLLPFGALAAQQTAHLSGVVRDSATSAGISDVVVALPGTMRTTVTDASGRFVLSALAAGSHTVVMQRLGYVRYSVTITLAAGERKQLEVSLTPAAQIIAPMVVSATREAQRRAEASATIEVIDGVAIRESRAAHPAEIAKRVPGVHVSQLSGEGHSTAIRQPITTKPMYLFLEDGVPTRSTGFFNHNALYEVNLPQSGGMEVLKGPGTALYGSDAIGGVINVLTRAAPVAPSADVSVEGGAYGYRRLLATGGFTAGAQGFRGDVNVTSADGWKDAAPYERHSATLRHDATLSSGLVLRSTVTGTTVDQRDVLALPRTDFDDRPELNRSPIAFRDVTAFRWSTAIERERGSTLVSLTPFARHNVLKLLPNWQLGFDPEVWDTRNNSIGLLAKVRRDFAPLRTRVIAGADIDLSPGSHRSDGITPIRTGPDSIASSYAVKEVHYDYDVTYRQLSPYMHLELSPVARVRLDVGLRYDLSGYDYETKLAPLATGRWRRPADTSLTYSRWSPKVGATVELTRDLSVYGSWRRGFRAPSQGQLFQQGANANTTGLEPVTADSREVGARGAFGGRAIWQLTAYDMRIHDDILGVLDATGIRTVSNAGETRHRGLELSLGVAVTPSLRVDGAYSSSMQTYEQWVIPVAGVNRSYASNTIEGAPRTLGNVLVTWSPVFLSGGRLAAEWTHTGRYYMDPENTQDYDGHRLLTLHASARVGQSGELFARLVNATGEEYAELATYSAFQREQLTPGSPRSLYAGLKYSWQR